MYEELGDFQPAHELKLTLWIRILCFTIYLLQQYLRLVLNKNKTEVLLDVSKGVTEKEETTILFRFRNINNN